MSEFPFGDVANTAVQEEPARPRRALVVGGGLLAAVAVGAGAFLFLSGRGGNGAVTAAPPARSGVAGPFAVGPTASPTPSPSAVGLPAPTIEHVARNPFKALYVVPVAAGPAAPAAPGAAPTVVPGAPAPAPVTPTPSPTVTPTAPTPAPTGDPTAPTVYAVKLLSISGGSASMVVDGKTMSIIVGQRFGREGELVVLSMGRSSLVLQVGADTPLPLVIGQSRGVL